MMDLPIPQGHDMSDDHPAGDNSTHAYEYRMRSIIREELKPILDEQARIGQKIESWEFAASIFRYFILATVGAVTVGASIYEWARNHLK